MFHLLSLINHQRPYTEKVYLHVKDPLELKYQLLVNGREIVGIKELKIPKPFIDLLQTIDDVNENLKGYDTTKKRQVLTVFDNMIGDVEANKKLSPIVTE